VTLNHVAVAEFLLHIPDGQIAPMLRTVDQMDDDVMGYALDVGDFVYADTDEAG